MKEVVIITENTKELFPFNCDGTNFNCRALSSAEEIKDYVRSNCGSETGKVLILTIVIPFEFYFPIFDDLKIFPFTDLFYQFVIFGKMEDLTSNEFNKFHNVSEFRISGVSEDESAFIIHKSFSIMKKHYNSKLMQNEYLNKLIDTRQDQEDLIEVGKSLSSEKDPDKLLRLILSLSKKITGADAGSVYLVEEDPEKGKRLRFKFSHTFSREIPLEEFVMDMNEKSISGYVAVTGEVLNIPDAYNISDESSYSFNSSFDKKHKYVSRSMLVVPMRNHADEIIGVMQLINSKEDLSSVANLHSGNEAFSLKLESMEDFDKFVVTFDEKYDSLLEAIAGQAAVAIENNRLIHQIQYQFEEFVKASVTAIESRDPATSGHSFRVAEICKAMAYAVNEVDDGYLKDFNFDENAIRELEFAALLHDYGKVYIDMNIFQKAKKLFPEDFENLIMRLDYLYRFVELENQVRETNILKTQVEEGKSSDILNNVHKEGVDKLNHIIDIKEKLISLNEPSVLDEDPAVILKRITDEINDFNCLSINKDDFQIITDNYKTNLSIKRGSLNPLEREEIESHVVKTYDFVSRIPWPPEYRNIPEIALRHHEKINGMGYPDGIKGREGTLLQSRIMSIADIYDALAASDRPYKKAVPLDRVIKILIEEAERDVLDVDLTELFIDKKIYECVDFDSFKQD